MTNGDNLKEKIEAHALEQMAVRRASASPLPGPLFDAFASEHVIQVGEIKVRKIVSNDWPIFEKLQSPLIELTKEKAQNDGGAVDLTVTNEQECEMVWQFTHTPRECRELMAEGREAFRERAVLEVGDSIDQPTVKLIIMAIMEHLKRSWQTCLEHQAKMEQEGQVTFFRDTTANKTASGGG